MKEICVSAVTENLPKVMEFIDAELESMDCPFKAQSQIDIAVDELYANIASYAYNPEEGPVTIRVEVVEEPLSVVITFIDNGIPYDPLAKDDPDVSLSAEERNIGGLGIFLTKKLMDDIEYTYDNGSNILTIKKNI